MGKAKKRLFYAVHRGREPGVYSTWDECQEQTAGYSNPKFKKFNTEQEAVLFVRHGHSTSAQLGPRDTLIKKTTPKSHVTDLKALANMGPDSLSTNNRFLHIYTDGSSLGNGMRGARAGIGAYFGPNDSRNISAPLTLAFPTDKPTNQKAEIQAVTEALKKVPADQDVLILTDSQYVCKAMTSWITKWRATGFLNVQNKEYFLDLDRLVTTDRTGRTEFQYIEAHCGHVGNECADELARRGAAQFVHDVSLN